jgi:hypothetical protein
MNTGLTSLAKLPEVGAAYPFAGMELVYTAILLAFTLAFFIKQVAMESHHHKTMMAAE